MFCNPLYKISFYQTPQNFAWQTSFNISYCVPSQALKLFINCMLENICILTFYIIPFFFSTLKFELHCLLTGIASDEKFALIFLCAYVCNIPSHLRLPVRFFSLSLVWSNLIMMCFGIEFLMSLALDIHCDFWLCWFIVCIQFEEKKTLAIILCIFSFISLLPLWMQITFIPSHLVMSHTSLILFIFYYSLFPVCLSFYYSLLEFTYLLFCNIKSDIYSTQGIFVSHNVVWFFISLI